MSKGRGTLRVSTFLWPDLGSPVTPQDWAKAILLPDDYEIERVERDEKVPGELFKLIVVSERIPASEYEIGVTMHHRIDNGVAFFDHIGLSLWNGQRWEEVANEQYST